MVESASRSAQSISEACGQQALYARSCSARGSGLRRPPHGWTVECQRVGQVRVSGLAKFVSAVVEGVEARRLPAAGVVADPGRPHSRFAGPKQEPSTRWGVLLLVVHSGRLTLELRDARNHAKAQGVAALGRLLEPRAAAASRTSVGSGGSVADRPRRLPAYAVGVGQLGDEFRLERTVAAVGERDEVRLVEWPA
jgi:hypothetical protein